MVLATFSLKDNYWDEFEITDVRNTLRHDNRISVTNKTKNVTYHTEHSLSERQIEMILEGSLINVVRRRQIHAS